VMNLLYLANTNAVKLDVCTDLVSIVARWAHWPVVVNRERSGRLL